MTGVDTLCVEILTRCSLRCVHCSANAAPERMELLPRSSLRKALAQLGILSEVFLSGGEPFEHPELPGLAAEARRAAEAVAVYSSGVRMTSRGHRALTTTEIGDVKAAGVSRIDLSVYASTADRHDEVTTLPGSFDITLETARRLRALGLPFGLHFVPIGDDGTQFRAVCEMASQLGACRLHVLAIAPQGRGKFLNPRIDPSTLEQLLGARGESLPFELIISSELRRMMGVTGLEKRDLLRAVFLDVRGYLYPGEGLRRPVLRSRTSVLEGVAAGDPSGGPPLLRPHNPTVALL